MTRERRWFEGRPVELATTDEAERRPEGELALAGETLVVRIWPKVSGGGQGDPGAHMTGEPVRSEVIYAKQPIVDSLDADRFKWSDDPSLAHWLDTQLRAVCTSTDERTRTA